MALQAFNLNRAQGPQIATLKLMEIAVPVEDTVPPVLDMTPEYVGNVTYNHPYNGVGPSAPGGNQPGADVNLFTANSTDDYQPRNQGNKANMLGTSLAVDITTPAGWIDPREPYGAAPLPTLASLNPTSRVVAPTDDLSLVLTGTNFMPSSRIKFAGNYERTTYVSPTELRTLIKGNLFTGPDPAIPVQVDNAGQLSGVQNFAITAAP